MLFKPDDRTFGNGLFHRFQDCCDLGFSVWMEDDVDIFRHDYPRPKVKRILISLERNCFDHPLATAIFR